MAALNSYYAPYYSGYPYYPYYSDYMYPGDVQQYLEMPLDYPDSASYSGPDSMMPVPTTRSEEAGTTAMLRDVQAALAREGYYQGQIDGTLGAQTREAIENYQKDNHLSPTGKVTRAMLNRLGL